MLIVRTFTFIEACICIFLRFIYVSDYSCFLYVFIFWQIGILFQYFININICNLGPDFFTRRNNSVINACIRFNAGIIVTSHSVNSSAHFIFCIFMKIFISIQFTFSCIPAIFFGQRTNIHPHILFKKPAGVLLRDKILHEKRTVYYDSNGIKEMTCPIYFL